MGVAGHGIGTVRALQLSEVSGAFASMAMVMNALLPSILIPLVLGASAWAG
jgi:putative effector of murein hydrolase